MDGGYAEALKTEPQPGVYSYHPRAGPGPRVVRGGLPLRPSRRPLWFTVPTDCALSHFSPSISPYATRGYENIPPGLTSYAHYHHHSLVPHPHHCPATSLVSGGSAVLATRPDGDMMQADKATRGWRLVANETGRHPYRPAQRLKPDTGPPAWVKAKHWKTCLAE